MSFSPGKSPLKTYVSNLRKIVFKKSSIFYKIQKYYHIRINMIIKINE